MDYEYYSIESRTLCVMNIFKLTISYLVTLLTSVLVKRRFSILLPWPILSTSMKTEPVCKV